MSPQELGRGRACPLPLPVLRVWGSAGLLGSFWGSECFLPRAPGAREKNRMLSVPGMGQEALGLAQWGAPRSPCRRRAGRPRGAQGLGEQPVRTRRLLTALRCPDDRFSWHSRGAGHVGFFPFKYSPDIKAEGMGVQRSGWGGCHVLRNRFHVWGVRAGRAGTGPASPPPHGRLAGGSVVPESRRDLDR